MTTPVVAITGASGFVGSVIADALQGRAHVLGLVRSPKRPGQIAWSFASDPERLASELRQCGATHLVHAAWDMTVNSLAELERSCVQGSRNLFEAAKRGGVERIIFISTISAFKGARSAYGRSKLQVEAMALEASAIVLRLGLVFGESDGGMFGNLRRVVRSSRLIPMIGRGMQPQYLLHERVLRRFIQQVVAGNFPSERSPITLAQPIPIPFRDLLLRIAKQENRSPRLIPVPWRMIYTAIRIAESLGLHPKFRSDSVLSFVFQNQDPDFSYVRLHNIDTSGGF